MSEFEPRVIATFDRPGMEALMDWIGANPYGSAKTLSELLDRSTTDELGQPLDEHGKKKDVTRYWSIGEEDYRYDWETG